MGCGPGWEGWGGWGGTEQWPKDEQGAITGEWRRNKGGKKVEEVKKERRK